MNSSGVLLIFGRFKGSIFMLKFCYTPWLLGDLDIPSAKFCWEKTICLFVRLCKNTGLDFLQIFLDSFILRINFSHISSTSWIYKSYEIVLSIWNITSTRNIIFCNLVQCMADNSCHISIITTNIMLIALVVDICVVESFLLS